MNLVKALFYWLLPCFHAQNYCSCSKYRWIYDTMQPQLKTICLQTNIHVELLFST